MPGQRTFHRSAVGAFQVAIVLCAVRMRARVGCDKPDFAAPASHVSPVCKLGCVPVMTPVCVSAIGLLWP